jgi:PIN domain nuclease of toxin-antitoxin system
VKFLIDTSVFLWGLAAEHKLNQRAKDILTSPKTELYFSAASSWEIAIKFALGSLPLPKAPSEYIPHALRSWAISAVDITHEHALRAGELPPHHRDPFGRLLIAQALSEQMILLTADRVFQKYTVEAVFCGK